MALLLRRAGTLEAIKVLEAPMDVSAFLSLGQLANLTQLPSGYVKIAIENGHL